MAWKIDRDYLAETPDESEVGRGQYDFENEEPMPHRFRLRDDDGIVYYGGRYNDIAELDDETWGGLYQAWQWGAGWAGTTDLQIKTKHGAWESVYG